jgi:hypothetical protein
VKDQYTSGKSENMQHADLADIQEINKLPGIKKIMKNKWGKRL